jgi:hypothetical protein
MNVLGQICERRGRNPSPPSTRRSRSRAVRHRSALPTSPAIWPWGWVKSHEGKMRGGCSPASAQKAKATQTSFAKLCSSEHTTRGDRRPNRRLAACDLGGPSAVPWGRRLRGLTLSPPPKEFRRVGSSAGLRGLGLGVEPLSSAAPSPRPGP